MVKSPGPNLLERGWLEVIKLNWNSIFNIQEENPQLQKILDAHKDVFLYLMQLKRKLKRNWINCRVKA